MYKSHFKMANSEYMFCILYNYLFKVSDDLILHNKINKNMLEHLMENLEHDM